MREEPGSYLEPQHETRSHRSIGAARLSWSGSPIDRQAHFPDAAACGLGAIDMSTSGVSGVFGTRLAILPCRFSRGKQIRLHAAFSCQLNIAQAPFAQRQRDMPGFL